MRIIVSMWSGPRNISTTMMRSFGARADARVLDEPFYACYLARSGAAHPYREETLARYPATVDGVLDWIARAADGEGLLFLKHIAYHLPDGIDLSFLLGHRNFLLIRDPRAMVASYAQKSADVAPIADSFAVARRIARRLAEARLPCPVVDAADILAAPAALLATLCAALGVPFDPAMLAWRAGPHPEDGPWAPHWYEAVYASTGFRPSVDKKPSLPRPLQAIAERSAADYRALAAGRLTA
jgi:hypothetical protein